jgi:hypothetical protein
MFCFQWQSRLSVHPVYLTYRWFLAILFLATMIFSICDPGRGNKNSGSWYISRWPIYLTHWGYTVCTTQALLGAWLLTCKLVAERNEGECHNRSATINNSFHYSEVEGVLQPTASQPVWLGIGHPAWAHDQMLVTVRHLWFYTLGHPLWQENRSVPFTYNCYWNLPALSLMGPSPAELITIWNCLILDCRPSRLVGYGERIITCLHEGHHSTPQGAFLWAPDLTVLLNDVEVNCLIVIPQLAVAL